MRPHPFDLVIFDCDGVLVDSERIAVGIDALVLARLGWEMSENEIVERFLGLSDQSQARAIEAHLGRPLPEGWQSEFDRLYREAYEARLRPVDGVVEALDRIRIPVCVASSGTHDKIRFTLGLAGLYGRFDGRRESTTRKLVTARCSRRTSNGFSSDRRKQSQSCPLCPRRRARRSAIRAMTGSVRRHGPVRLRRRAGPGGTTGRGRGDRVR